MSLWPQRGMRCAFSIQRTVYQSFCIQPSQRNLAQSFRLSIYNFAEFSKRFYAGNEGHIKKEDIDLTNSTSGQTEISNKVQQERKSQDVGQFFSSKSNKITDQEELQSLLLHCDRAIILSRDSSDSNTFWTAKDHLFQATRIYVNMVKRSSLKSDLDVLSYETYLIRSGYAHVIRTIGALIGRDGVIVCARMMQDLLQWELDLSKMNFESADGSEAWYKKRKERRLKEEIVKRKPLDPNEKELVFIEESVLSSGPFLQDLAPIFYDIINELTSESGKGSVHLRKYINREHETLAKELRLLIRQIPQQAWDNPVSPDWYRFRTSNLESFSNSSSVIDASIKMMAQAYAKSTKTLSTLQLCLDEMAYFSSPNKHTARLQLLVSQSFRYQVRTVSNFLTDEDDAEVVIVQEKLQELLETFDLIFSILFDSRGKGSFIRLSILLKQEFTTILRSLFNSIRLFEDHKSLRCFEAEQKEKAKQLSLGFRSWLQHCIEVNNQGDQVRLPRNLSIGTFNMILHKFMVSSPLFGEASIGTASKLIDYMLTSDDAPQPDEITLTILIANSARLRDAKVLRSAILAAHLSLRKQFRQKYDDKSDHLNSVMFSLLKNAVDTNDGARMIALMDAARFALSHPLNNDVPLDVAYISSQKVIMLLYPSLQIDRPRYPVRRSRMRKFKAKRKRERKLESIHGNSIALHLTDQKTLNEKKVSDFNILKESHIAAQFHPSVLIAALHLTVKQGKTGLAERIWRLWLRVIKRQSYEQGEKANYDSVRALTILNRLYALEVKRDDIRKARLKAYSAILHGFPSSFGPRIYGRTREHRLALSLRSKRSVIGWAYEFKRNLNVDTQITRSLMARKVTRLRYLQMREIWLSKRDQLRTSVVEGLNDTLPIPVSQIVFSDRPDYPFYHTLLSVFRRNGSQNLRFDDTLFQQDDSLLKFFKLIEFDMKTFGLEVPLDFHTWISKHDQSSK